jgi:hypothetical protein
MSFTFILFLIFRLVPDVELVEQVCLNEDEKQLFDIINAYRETLDLKSIPYSASLSKVAQAHVQDLAANYTFKRGAKCNPHSWSKKGEWTSCCYTSDHKKASCMWDKPREIAGFDSNGYEILSYSSDGVTPGEALIGWQNSRGHHEVMINSATWEKVTWGGMGVGIYEEWAVVWFAEKSDAEAGMLIQLCQ